MNPLHAALQRHATALLGRWLRRASREGWLRFDNQDGTRIWPDEVQRLFSQRNLAMLGSDLPDVQATPDDAFAAADWQTLCAAIDAAIQQGDAGAERWRDLLERLAPSPAEAQLLALLCALHFDQALLRAYRFAWADFMAESMRWGFAVKLLSPQRDLAARLHELDPATAPLFRHGLITLHAPRPETPLAERHLGVADDVAAFLIGLPVTCPEHHPHEACGEPPPRLRTALRPRLRRCLQAPAPLRVAIQGPRGSGRTALASQLAEGARCRGGLWRVDLGHAVAHGEALDNLRRAKRMAALLDTAIVIHGLQRLGDDAAVWIERATQVLAPFGNPVIWLCEADVPAALTLAPEAILALPYPSRGQREEVWRAALTPHLDDAAAATQLAGAFLLAEGQILRVVQRATATPPPNPAALMDALSAEARSAAELGLGRLATPEHGRVAMDQLVVSDETALALEELIVYAGHRQQLADEWGFGAAMPYGLGLTALFAGPPGTGKTFAAQALATALCLELYRVDLSQLVSKYIGETEKHLAELFSAAEQGEVLLLFDEADSLFGKRTEVKTSVDRYANLEVNYLLQRIERFSGVTILTTNFEAGIDDAFARRIRFRVAFDAPDEAARALLWRKLLPAAVPLDDDVDFDVLAEHFELSGGHIKEILLRAASLALVSPQRRLTQNLLIRSCKVEYKKLGKLPLQIFDDEEGDSTPPP